MRGFLAAQSANRQSFKAQLEAEKTNGFIDHLNGTPRFIEVKTNRGNQEEFYVSRNEFALSKHKLSHFISTAYLIAILREQRAFSS